MLLASYLAVRLLAIDPADRFLVAQARELGNPLLSAQHMPTAMCAASGCVSRQQRLDGLLTHLLGKKAGLGRWQALSWLMGSGCP